MAPFQNNILVAIQIFPNSNPTNVLNKIKSLWYIGKFSCLLGESDC